MPKQGVYDNTYPLKLQAIGLTIIGEFCGAKKHHDIECVGCGSIFTATPISKLQNFKKHNMKGCPDCTSKQRYSSYRKLNLQKLKDRGIEILSKDYDGRFYLDYDADPHKKIKVKNLNCGHEFECSPSNLLGAETECAICGPQKRVEPLIQWSKANSKKWKETATEWEIYRNTVHETTRLLYNNNKQKINPYNYKRGRAGTVDAYQLDHIVPVRFCFDNNVPAKLCADISNLQMLKWTDNLSSKASIKGSLPPQFLQYVESGKRIKTLAKTLKNEIFPKAKLFYQLDDINITLYDKKTKVGVVIIPLDKSFANRKTANISMETMQKNDIKPFIIFEDELNKSFIVNKIKHYIGKSDNNITRIHGRKCTIIQIDKRDKSKFLNTYHIQGSDKANISYGAYYEDELVAVMTFTKPRVLMGYKNPDRSVYNCVWELSRFATNTNYRIPGIASKLLSTFKKENEWKKIISYADKRWSVGNLYDILGFTMEKSNPPDYFYIVNGHRRHRWNYRKDKLKETLPNYNPNLTEYENMENAGYYRIWGCGTLRYVLINT